MSDFRKGYAKVIAKAWADPGFKDQLKADPKGTLQKEGVPLPDQYKSAELQVVEDSAGKKHLVIPEAKDTAHNSDDGIASCC